ncbi:MAG: Na+/H+ ion antiporter subunit [Actinomycetota bacterium]|nr:Na+/H+ ion antiporter subunit [Actinomycetota bacterium]
MEAHLLVCSYDAAVRARIGWWAVWWVALLCLWLLLVTVSVAELIAGVVAAAIAATAAEVVRAQGLVRFDPDPRWLLRVWKIPRSVVRDCWLLTVVLVRYLRGRPVPSGFRAIPFDSGGDDARASARRALVVLAISVSPNTYVVGIDEDADLMLVHRFMPPPKEAAEREILADL